MKISFLHDSLTNKKFVATMIDPAANPINPIRDSGHETPSLIALSRRSDTCWGILQEDFQLKFVRTW